jgi:hypothetical protein
MTVEALTDVALNVAGRGTLPRAATIRRHLEAFEHPSADLTVKLPAKDPDFNGKSNPHRRRDAMTCAAYLLLDGVKVGHVHLRYFRAADDALCLAIDHLTLRQEADTRTERDRLMRRGLGGPLIEHLLRSAQTMGCERAQLVAVNDGSYVWAAVGFDFDPRTGHQQEVRERLTMWAEHHVRRGVLTDDILTALQTENPQTAHAISQFGRDRTYADERGETQWLGRETMLVSTWHGVKLL